MLTSVGGLGMLAATVWWLTDPSHTASGNLARLGALGGAWLTTLVGIGFMHKND